MSREKKMREVVDSRDVGQYRELPLVYSDE